MQIDGDKPDCNDDYPRYYDQNNPNMLEKKLHRLMICDLNK
jgi:hypothetical protein